MKTLILYATKYGAAREIAKRIAEKMGGAALHDFLNAPFSNWLPNNQLILI